MPVDVESAYRAHGPMVLRRCRRLLRDEAKAVDAMHDVFVEMLRRREILDGAPTALLLTMATNVCLNRLRHDRRRPEDADDERLRAIAAHGVEARTEDRSLARRLLDRWLGGESESTRLMAVLHYVDRLTLEEVAAEVGLSVSGVRARLRGLQQRVRGAEALP
jgi:RNA polymerase sigma-70 factor, ECF subfamily